MSANVTLTSEDLKAILDLFREYMERKRPVVDRLGGDPVRALTSLKSLLTAEEYESVRKAYVRELIEEA